MKYLLIFAIFLFWGAPTTSILAQPNTTIRRSQIDLKRIPPKNVLIVKPKAKVDYRTFPVFKPEDIRKTPGRKRPNGEGPISINKVHLDDFIKSEVPGVQLEALGLDTRILRDGNPKSGYFYYHPLEYELGWSPSTGKPDIEITYQGVSGSADGLATVTATLYPKHLPGDVEMARDMLVRKLKGNKYNLPEVNEFVEVPQTEPAVLEIESLQQFGVSGENITYSVPSRLYDPIKITFTTSQVDILLAMFFNNVGIYGALKVSTTGFENGGISIPIKLKIDAPETYGAFELAGTNWRNEWRNSTDYPVSIGHFHALRKERNGDYRIYSWKATETTVPPGAKINFGSSSIPTWIDKDRRVKRIWIDYSISDCGECDDKVKAKILESIRQDDVAKPEKLEFTILNAMAFTEASLIRIKLRSTQAAASGNEKIEMESIKVAEDGSFLDGGTLYVRDGKVDFEYKMVVYLEDGTTYESDWIPSNSKEVVIGSRQIRDNIPAFNE